MELTHVGILQRTHRNCSIVACKTGCCTIHSRDGSHTLKLCSIQSSEPLLTNEIIWSKSRCLVCCVQLHLADFKEGSSRDNQPTDSFHTTYVGMFQGTCLSCMAFITSRIELGGKFISKQDVDQFGNNSVHLAASGGNLIVFQTLLFYGVAVDRPNTRGHTAKDLATNVYILQLIKCLEQAGQTNKYFCMTCRKFYK